MLSPCIWCHHLPEDHVRDGKERYCTRCTCRYYAHAKSCQSACWTVAAYRTLVPVRGSGLPCFRYRLHLAVQFQTAEQEMASTLFLSTVLSLPTMGVFIWLMGG